MYNCIKYEPQYTLKPEYEELRPDIENYVEYGDPAYYNCTTITHVLSSHRMLHKAYEYYPRVGADLIIDTETDKLYGDTSDKNAPWYDSKADAVMGWDA